MNFSHFIYPYIGPGLNGLLSLSWHVGLPVNRTPVRELSRVLVENGEGGRLCLILRRVSSSGRASINWSFARTVTIASAASGYASLVRRSISSTSSGSLLSPLSVATQMCMIEFCLVMVTKSILQSCYSCTPDTSCCVTSPVSTV